MRGNRIVVSWHHLCMERIRHAGQSIFWLGCGRSKAHFFLYAVLFCIRDSRQWQATITNGRTKAGANRGIADGPWYVGHLIYPPINCDGMANLHNLWNYRRFWCRPVVQYHHYLFATMVSPKARIRDRYQRMHVWFFHRDIRPFGKSINRL